MGLGGAGGAGPTERLADAERMLGGTRERLGRLAEQLAELRRRLLPGEADRGGARADALRQAERQGGDAEDPPAR